MKKLFFMMLVVCVLLALAACGGGRGSGLPGEWEGRADGMALVLVFSSDGTGYESWYTTGAMRMRLSRDRITWETDSGNLTITLGVNSRTYEYEIDGNTLTLSRDAFDGERTYVLQRN